MDEKQRQFIRQLCLKSFYHFVNLIVLPFRIPADSRLPFKRAVHEVACHHVQKQKTHRVGLLMPRYFGKSFCITESKPIWDWLHNHEERILIANETYTRAKQFLSVIKANIESNQFLHYYFPETILPDGWNNDHRWSADALDMPRKGVYREPTFFPIGVGGASQGMHVTKAYLDDLIGKSARDSLVVRLDTERWFDSLPELLEIPDRTHKRASDVYLIGTHWGPGDLYCTIKERYPFYKWLTIPPEDMQGNPTWPEKYSAEAIAEDKSDPQRYAIFLTQMCNNPIATDITDFKPAWLKYYETVILETGETAYKYTTKVKIRDMEFEDVDTVVPLSDMDISATIDPAVSESSAHKTARTAIVIIGTSKEGKRIVLEAWAQRLNRNKDLYDKVFEFHQKYRPKRWGIETFAQQNFILRALREESSTRSVYLPISSLPKDVGANAKDIRIRSLQDDFVAGDIYINKNMREFVGEYLAFPIGTTKDLLDAMAYHKKWWTKTRKESVTSDQNDRYMKFLESRPHSPF